MRNGCFFRNRIRVWAAALLATLAGPAPAAAQNVADPPETARIRLGALALTPRFGVKNLGIDTNIFNLSTEPERDLTATMTGGSDTWLKVGRASFAGRTTLDWHYFRKAADQRSMDVSQEGRVALDLLRLVPRAGGSIVNTRQRPNEEFDLRVQQSNRIYFVGVMVPVGSKGRVDTEIRVQDYDYSTGRHGDGAVAFALNRKSEIAALEAGFDVTPLTRVVVRTDLRRDRFAFIDERNSNSLRVMPGLELQPSALVSGTALIGYRTLETQSATVPDFSGLVASVDLKFVAMDVFRLSGQFSRDVDYSTDLDDSVYVSTNWGFDAVRAIGLDWDVVGRIRRSSLAYQELPPVAGRIDRVWLSGAGIGRRVGTELRVGFDVDYVNRSSVRGNRTYDGFRCGASVMYGY